MKEEIYTLIIGFLLGIVSIIISNQINKIGKVKIYAKLVHSKITCDKGGFKKSQTYPNSLLFHIPLWIELHNTSNVVRVIRNFNILLYDKGIEIGSMTQINSFGAQGSSKTWLANNGSYSFILPPRSIQKFDCYFVIHDHELKINSQFNEIKLRYYDEKDKVHTLPLRSIENCWEISEIPTDDDWHLITK